MSENTSPRQRGSTRARILDAALALFAEHGFRRTTVGDIESAVGLAPRSGGLYKHFESKHALMEAIVAREVERAAARRELIADFDPGDQAREALRRLGDVMLLALDLMAPIAHATEKDGDRFPELLSASATEIVQGSYASIAEWIRRHLETRGLDSDPADAYAVLIGAPLINFVRTQWTWGTPPAMVDRERFLDTWAIVADEIISGSIERRVR